MLAKGERNQQVLSIFSSNTPIQFLICVYELTNPGADTTKSTEQ